MFLAFSPISCSKNTYTLTSIGKSHGKHPAINKSETEEAFFKVVAMFKVTIDDPHRSIKGILGFLEGNTVLLLVYRVLVLVPFK